MSESSSHRRDPFHAGADTAPATNRGKGKGHQGQGSGGGTTPPPPPPDTTPAAITLSAATLTLTIGRTQSLSATVTNAEGAVLDAATAPVTWASDNPAVASVTQTGVVASLAQGTANITATAGAITSAPCVVTVSAVVQPPPPPTQPGDPELPRATVDTTYPGRAPNTVYAVATVDELNAALAAAQPGDDIALAAGAVFSGHFTLPAKAGAGYIVIRTEGAALPPQGTRLVPADVAALNLAAIVTPDVSYPIQLAPGARCWWLSGVEVAATPQGGGVDYQYGLIVVGDNSIAVDSQPSLIVDRCHVHGGEFRGNGLPVSVQHAIIFNGINCACVDSTVDNIYWPGTDTQAILGWTGVGPVKVENNTLEAAAENIMLGGADPTIAGLVPADWTIRHNHLTKRLDWRGKGYSVKNLFELKNATRVLFEGNVCEHNWSDAQSGWAFVIRGFTDRPAAAPWTQVTDITIRRNLIQHSGNGLEFDQQGLPTARILVEDNVVLDIGNQADAPTAPEEGKGIALFEDMTSITLRHNTLVRNAGQSYEAVILDGSGATGIVIEDNILAPAAPYGMVAGGGEGTAALTAYAGTSWSCARNVTWGEPNPASYPSDNYFAADEAAVGFTDAAGGDYSLAPTSPYKGVGSLGSDPGADWAAVQAEIAGVVV